MRGLMIDNELQRTILELGEAATSVIIPPTPSAAKQNTTPGGSSEQGSSSSTIINIFQDGTLQQATFSPKLFQNVDGLILWILTQAQDKQTKPPANTTKLLLTASISSQSPSVIQTPD